MVLRPDLQAILDGLLASGRAEVTLDEVAEAFGTQLAVPADVELLIAALEERGVQVGATEDVDLHDELSRVLAAARSLSSELGRAPSAEEIAASSGLERDVVRRALLYARVLIP